jgi:hypothetical protein
VEERGDLDLNVFEAGRQAGLEEPAANVPPPVGGRGGAGGWATTVGRHPEAAVGWDERVGHCAGDRNGPQDGATLFATGYRRARSEQTLLSMHSDWLAERAPEVNYSARILFQELRAGRGYAGSYQTVRDAVRPLRVNATAASLTQRRFETEPGEPGPKATSTSGWPRCWPRTSTASSTWAG